MGFNLQNVLEIDKFPINPGHQLGRDFIPI